MRLRIIMDMEFDDHEELVKVVEKSTRQALVVTRREKVLSCPVDPSVESDGYFWEHGTCFDTELVYKHEDISTEPVYPLRAISFLRCAKVRWSESSATSVSNEFRKWQKLRADLFPAEEDE